MTTRRDLAMAAKAWPFEEARKLLDRVNRDEAKGATKPYVLFETGYGPSGLPHIGTFGEVARTSWVRRAFAELSEKPTRLFAFSVAAAVCAVLAWASVGLVRADREQGKVLSFGLP